jgi:hypothetical protein
VAAAQRPDGHPVGNVAVCGSVHPQPSHSHTLRGKDVPRRPPKRTVFEVPASKVNTGRKREVGTEVAASTRDQVLARDVELVQRRVSGAGPPVPPSRSATWRTVSYVSAWPALSGGLAIGMRGAQVSQSARPHDD